MLDYLMSVMPVRTSWTIFTLQSGSADEVANMLKLLLPDVSVSSATPTSSSTSFFGGISNSFNQLGSGIADMTGLSTLGSTASLTIIPDARLNSLFVSGPESKVQEVEQLLEVLDASEWSAGELRERRPRMIEVKHAEVVDVYERVSEIYANYLETGRNGGGRNQQNPFQMLVGGGRGGGGGGGGQDNEVKLTISADTRTNHLIVSANDALFSEIQALVDDMDQKVFEAKRTVRLVALQHASPNLVKNAVSTLMPKVTVSGTGGGNNNNNQQFGYPGFRGGDNDDRGGSSGDDMRRMM
jgi:type II secretory pathway component GspD/PulD (secretin)